MKSLFKVNWLAALLFPLLVLLSGCGGGGGGGNDLPDDGGNNYQPIQVVYNGNAVVNGTHVSMDLTFKKGSDSENAQVVIEGFKFYGGGDFGCQIVENTVTYSHTEISVYPTTLHIEGNFSPTDCIPKYYTLEYTEKVTISGHTKTYQRTKSGQFDESDTPGGGTYEMSVAPESIRVHTAGQRETVRAQVLHNGLPAADINVTVLLDLKYGNLSASKAVTDSNGLVSVDYTAPDKIGSLEGEEADLKIFLTEHQTVSKVVKLSFQKSEQIDTTHMRLYAVPNEMNVSEDGESRSISIYLEDTSRSEPVKGATIKADFFDPSKGTMASYYATTNDNGQAVFNYIAPDTLPGSPLTITFEVDNATTTLTTDVTVNFVHSDETVDTSGLNLDAVPDELNITAAGENRTISLYVSNTSTHSPVPGMTVKAWWFDPDHGTLNAYEAVTNANGQAVFDYNAPSELPSSSVTITFEIKNGSPALTKEVKVNFVNAQPIDTNQMTLFAVPESVTIGRAGETRAISLYLAKGTDVVPGILIKAHFFDPNTGTLDSYEATTNANGQAVFNYRAPGELPSSDINITFEVANGNPALIKKVAVKFEKETTEVDTNGMTMYAVPESLNIDHPEAEETINIYLSKDNAAVGNVRINAHFFDPATGTLASYDATTDANGRASFLYLAPAELPDSAINITFEVANGNPALTKDVQVAFSPAPPVDTDGMNLYAIPQELNVSKPGESRSISLFLENGDTHSPVEGISIKGNFFDPNFGSLESYSGTTDENGKVTFIYRVPDTLPSEDFNLTFGVANGSPSLERNVSVRFDHARYTIVPESNVTVTLPNHGYAIDVTLNSTSEDNITRPAVGKSVVAEFLMPMYGRIAVYETTVGSDGHATFDYTSPGRISDLNDTNVTFYFKDNPNVRGKTALLFRPQSVDEVEKLYIIPERLVITEPGEERNITIVTVNNDNIGKRATVVIEQPDINSTDYGTFIPAGPITTDASGRATVLYRAPDSINGLSERNITFSIEDKASLTKELVIDYDQGTGPGIRYEITLKTPNSLAVDQLEQVTVVIHEYGDVTKTIDDDNVHEVNMTTRFSNILTFGGNQNTYRYASSGTKAVDVQTHTLSGTGIIDINASIYNGDQNVTLHGSFPVVVLSGPVAAMSLFYAYTSEDKDLGIYKNTYTIHAVDKYNNPAQAGIALHPSIINGAKVVKSRLTTGTIHQGDPQKDTFTDSVADTFATVSEDDHLAIVPNPIRNSKDYLGNWSFDSVDANQLVLSENYFGATENNLSYVIGNANRYIDGRGIAVVDIKDKDGKGFVTDENGNVQFEVTFDPILAGHTVTISANTYDDGNRTGVAMITALRWGEYSSSKFSVTNDGSNYVGTLSLGISGIEPLVGVEIAANSIVSSSSQCMLVDASVPGSATNLHSDSNGEITVEIATLGTDSDVKTCTIQWNAEPGSIYLEY